jgi:hypothetical protein
MFFIKNILVSARGMVDPERLDTDRDSRFRIRTSRIRTLSYLHIPGARI